MICGFLLFLCLTGTILDLAVEVYSGSATPAKAHHNTVNQHNNFTPATSSILTIESHGGETTSGLNSDDVVLLLPKQPSLYRRVSSAMKGKESVVEYTHVKINTKGRKKHNS